MGVGSLLGNAYRARLRLTTAEDRFDSNAGTGSLFSRVAARFIGGRSFCCESWGFPDRRHDYGSRLSRIYWPYRVGTLKKRGREHAGGIRTRIALYVIYFMCLQSEREFGRDYVNELSRSDRISNVTDTRLRIQPISIALRDLPFLADNFEI